MMKNKMIDEIEKNRKYIEAFPLESEEGTKRMKAKFKKDSIKKRNKFVAEEIEKYKKIKEDLYSDLQKQFDRMMPADSSNKYSNYDKKINEMARLLKCINSADDNVKCGVTEIISRLEYFENNDIFAVNNLLKKYISLFEKMGVTLSKTDFNYSPYTYIYMDKFFSTLDYLYFEMEVKKEFDRLYWECPLLTTHLKLNLIQISEKYKKQIKKYVEKLNVDSELLINFQKMLKEYEVYKKFDIYILVKQFLDGSLKIDDYLSDSPKRKEIFNSFCEKTFDDISDTEKEAFYYNIFDLNDTINEFEKYNEFKEIIDDLIEKFKNKDSYKGILQTKLKEITKEENVRKKLCDKYFRLIKKKDAKLLKTNTIEINNQIVKLNTLYEELVAVRLNSKIYELSSSASLYDLMIVSCNNYSYAYKKLLENINNFIKFIYNPSNKLVTDISASCDFDMKELIYKKYDLINLKLDDGQLDNLVELKEKINYVMTVYYVEKSNLTFEDIKCMYTIKNL